MTTNPIGTSHFGQIGLGTVVNQVTGVNGYTGQVPNALILDAPLTADTTYYLNLVSLNANTLTVNKSPDYPRNVTIVASGSATGNVVVNGLDTNGYVISETLALNGNTPVVGLKSFSKVLTVQIPTVGATTISMGFGIKFGLNFQTTLKTVFLALLDGVPDSNLGTTVVGGSTSGTDFYGTWSPATAPNSTRNFAMYYIPTNLNSFGVNN